MSTPDHITIENALSSSNSSDIQQEDYSYSEYEYINDVNQGNYTTGSVRFDATNLRNKYIIWADAYLLCTIAVSSSTGTAYTVTSPISFKQSSADLFTGVQVQVGANVPVNDQDVQTINRLRNLMHTTISGADGGLQNFGFDKDRSSTVGQVVGTTSLDLNVTPQIATADPHEFTYASSVITVQNVNFNKGFYNRIASFKAMSTFNSGTFTAQVKVPLRMLHSFFQCLDFPLINSEMQFTFYTPCGPTTAITSRSPFLVGSGAAVPQAQFVNQKVQIYYRTVKFNLAANIEMAKRLEAGYTKKLIFSAVNMYYPHDNTAANNTSSYQDQIVASVKWPQRVFLLLTPNTARDVATVPFICPGIVNNINIKVGNANYYNQPLITDNQIWAIVDENTVAHGVSMTDSALIGFNDFKSNYRIHLCDITRTKDVIKPDDAVSIEFDSLKVDSSGFYNTALDFVYVVERRAVIELKMSAGSSTIIGQENI